MEGRAFFRLDNRSLRYAVENAAKGEKRDTPVGDRAAVFLRPCGKSFHAVHMSDIQRGK